MDIKARSKPMREILTRVVDRTRGQVEIIIFGDKVILDEGEIYAFAPVPKEEPTLMISQMWRTGRVVTFSSHSSLRTFRWTKP